jgi:hypothetical protein
MTPQRSIGSKPAITRQLRHFGSIERPAFGMVPVHAAGQAVL